MLRLICMAGILWGLVYPGDRAWAQSDIKEDKAAVMATHTWALLIGVEKYHHAPPLRYTRNDVLKLSETLQKYAGVAASHVLTMTDDKTSPKEQPLRTSIQTEIPKWLKKITADDTVILYFTGHGFRDSKDQMYLAPVDCHPDHPEDTGVPIAWLREQIAACPAKLKMLVIDACHAGSEKGKDDKESVVGSELGRVFEDLEGVVTLASSKAEEKSLIWEEVQQSLFSYWLCQGLKGHADKGDGAVDIDELYRYLHAKVETVAEAKFSRKQTPVRIVRSGTVGVPPIIALQPQPIKQVLGDLAEQLALDLNSANLNAVGVIEFLDHSELKLSTASKNFGALGKWLTRELQEQLTVRGQGRFSVVDSDRLTTALQEQGFSAADLNSDAALRQLSSKMGGLPVLGIGKMKSRSGSLLHLEVTLYKPGALVPVGTVAGYASMTENEWAMMGHSAVLTSNDYYRPSPRPDTPFRPAGFHVIPRLDARVKDDHPLKKGGSEFNLKIMINDEERKPVFHDNEAYIPVHRGEEFEIWVENHTNKLHLMRLLVDGLNTLPEKEDGKGISTWLQAQRVSLDVARPWVLDPQFSKVNAVRGFVKNLDGANSELNRFKVVDADQSLAAQQKFTEQIGLITAVFYEAVAAKSGSVPRGRLGVTLGQHKVEDIQKAAPHIPGNQRAIISLRYVDADDLQSIGK